MNTVGVWVMTDSDLFIAVARGNQLVSTAEDLQEENLHTTIFFERRMVSTIWGDQV